MLPMGGWARWTGLEFTNGVLLWFTGMGRPRALPLGILWNMVLIVSVL